MVGGIGNASREGAEAGIQGVGLLSRIQRAFHRGGQGMIVGEVHHKRHAVSLLSVVGDGHPGTLAGVEGLNRHLSRILGGLRQGR